MLKRQERKKRSATNKDDTVTVNNNGQQNQFTLVLSVDTYRYVTQTLEELLKAQEQNEEVEINIKQLITYKQDTVFCRILKVDCVGQTGYVTINFYHTTSKILIKGKTQYTLSELEYIQSKINNNNHPACEELSQSISSYLNSQDDTVHDTSQTAVKSS